MTIAFIMMGLGAKRHHFSRVALDRKPSRDGREVASAWGLRGFPVEALPHGNATTPCQILTQSGAVLVVLGPVFGQT